jgi:hypothetical protein
MVNLNLSPALVKVILFIIEISGFVGSLLFWRHTLSLELLWWRSSLLLNDNLILLESSWLHLNDRSFLLDNFSLLRRCLVIYFLILDSWSLFVIHLLLFEFLFHWWQWLIDYLLYVNLFSLMMHRLRLWSLLDMLK